MLTCPHCQNRIQEDSSTCPHCALSLEGAISLLGPVPLLNRGLTDSTQTLSEKQKKSVTTALKRLEQNFPAHKLNIAICHFDSKFDLSTQLFWLFNTAGLSPQTSQLDSNQDILLALDPENQRLGLMIGYGLEPFIPKEVIASLLELARPALEEDDPHNAILLIIKKLAVLLTNASQTARKTLGLYP